MLFTCTQSKVDTKASFENFKREIDYYIFDSSCVQGFDLSNAHELIIASIKGSLARNIKVILLANALSERDIDYSILSSKHYLFSEKFIFLAPSIKNQIKKINYLELSEFKGFLEELKLDLD